jgi:polygalacturonase
MVISKDFGIPNVFEFGAVGDGVADDTSAIQSVINYTISNNGKAIFFPKGSYKTGILSNSESLVFVGDGASFTNGNYVINQIGYSNKVTSSITNGNIKIDDVETIVYTHPNGDGNLHVPATGSTNNSKALKAGSIAGSLSWGNIDWSELTNKPLTFDVDGTTPGGNEANKVAITDGNGRVGDSIRVGGVYVRNNNGTAEWSIDNSTWHGFGLTTAQIISLVRRY